MKKSASEPGGIFDPEVQEFDHLTPLMVRKVDYSKNHIIHPYYRQVPNRSRRRTHLEVPKDGILFFHLTEV